MRKLHTFMYMYCHEERVATNNIYITKYANLCNQTRICTHRAKLTTPFYLARQNKEADAIFNSLRQILTK